MEKCRNCEAPLKGARHCPACGADSQAKKFEAGADPLEEIAKLTAKVTQQGLELEALKNPKKKDTDDI